jgi:hypothetical protein
MREITHFVICQHSVRLEPADCGAWKVPRHTNWAIRCRALIFWAYSKQYSAAGFKLNKASQILNEKNNQIFDIGFKLLRPVFNHLRIYSRLRSQAKVTNKKNIIALEFAKDQPCS